MKNRYLENFKSFGQHPQELKGQNCQMWQKINKTHMFMVFLHPQKSFNDLAAIAVCTT